MRFLVLTSILVTAATAVAGTQLDEPCPPSDRAPEAVAGGPADQDHDRRPGSVPVVATAGNPSALPPAPGAVTADLLDLVDAPRAAAVIPFAPKTSPPRVRWF